MSDCGLYVTVLLLTMRGLCRRLAVTGLWSVLFTPLATDHLALHSCTRNNNSKSHTLRCHDIWNPIKHHKFGDIILLLVPCHFAAIFFSSALANKFTGEIIRSCGKLGRYKITHGVPNDIFRKLILLAPLHTVPFVHLNRPRPSKLRAITPVAGITHNPLLNTISPIRGI